MASKKGSAPKKKAASKKKPAKKKLVKKATKKAAAPKKAAVKKAAVKKAAVKKAAVKKAAVKKAPPKKKAAKKGGQKIVKGKGGGPNSAFCVTEKRSLGNFATCQEAMDAVTDHLADNPKHHATATCQQKKAAPNLMKIKLTEARGGGPNSAFCETENISLGNFDTCQEAMDAVNDHLAIPENADHKTTATCQQASS
jgi:hypothetical protein